MDTSYVAAVCLILVGILKTFGIAVSQDAITGIATGIIALVIAYKQKTEKNLTIGGARKF